MTPEREGPRETPIPYEPLDTRPGYNASPIDWVRYAAHLEALLALPDPVREAATGVVEAKAPLSLYPAIDRLRAELDKERAA